VGRYDATLLASLGGAVSVSKTYIRGTGNPSENLGHSVSIQLRRSRDRGRFAGSFHVPVNNSRGAFELHIVAVPVSEDGGFGPSNLNNSRLWLACVAAARRNIVTERRERRRLRVVPTAEPARRHRPDVPRHLRRRPRSVRCTPRDRGLTLRHVELL
jgi:hypothetical protein